MSGYGVLCLLAFAVVGMPAGFRIAMLSTEVESFWGAFATFVLGLAMPTICMIVGLLIFPHCVNAYDWTAPDDHTVAIVSHDLITAAKTGDRDAQAFIGTLSGPYLDAHPKGGHFGTFLGCVGAKIGGLEALHTIRFADGVEAMRTFGSFQTYRDSLPPEAVEIGLRLGDLHAIAFHCNQVTI